jgi:hypothetical protein
MTGDVWIVTARGEPLTVSGPAALGLDTRTIMVLCPECNGRLARHHKGGKPHHFEHYRTRHDTPLFDPATAAAGSRCRSTSRTD